MVHSEREYRKNSSVCRWHIWLRGINIGNRRRDCSSHLVKCSTNLKTAVLPKYLLPNCESLPRIRISRWGWRTLFYSQVFSGIRCKYIHPTLMSIQRMHNRKPRGQCEQTPNLYHPPSKASLEFVHGKYDATSIRCTIYNTLALVFVSW